IKDLELPSVRQNLFVDLAEKIAGELNVTRWVCGGPEMVEEWPWRSTSLSAQEILKGNYTLTSSKMSLPEGWVLSSIVPGEDCLWRTG
ncbi:ENR1 protein, partial [Campylorhamphus procurvoides]|nr:ENR1 protein [Campylorhamphus procurvoides]